MKITNVKVHLIDTGREHQLPQYGKVKTQAGIVRVFTDEGIEGNADYPSWGLHPKLLGELILAMKPHIVGEDPFNVERIWERTYKTTRRIVSIYASGCINVALWDIMGKVLNVPLYRLLGGFRDRLRAYAGTPIGENVEGFVKLATSLVERGFTAIKLHPWADPDRDIELCRAVRKAVGDGVDLMIDPHGMYDRRDAMRVGRVVDELNFYWYEEPLPESDVEGYIELCQRLDVPVSGVDTLRLSLGNYADYIARGAFDIVQADASCRGITWAKKAAALAESFGRRFQTHASGTPLHQAANFHLLCAIPNGGLLEIPIPEGRQNTAMKDSIIVDQNGWVSVPQKPGLGLEIDWDRMNKLTFAVLE